MPQMTKSQIPAWLIMPKYVQTSATRLKILPMEVLAKALGPKSER